jgi:hypothetical protein
MTESYEERENMWDEAWPTTGEDTAGHPADELDVADEDSPFPNVTGTYDTIASVRDAEPYVPAIDPPTLPGGSEGIDVATGFGLSADEETSKDPAPRGDEDIREEAILALRQDSLTAELPWSFDITNGVIRLRGEVSSVDEAEHALTLLGNIDGVVDVVDETTLAPVNR